MSPHVHAGVLEFVVFVAMLVLALFLFRAIETRYPDSPFGKGLVYLHG